MQEGEEFGPSIEETGEPLESFKPEAALQKSWEELRESAKATPYSKQFTDFMEKSKKWLSEPRAGMPPEEWNSEIDVQLNKATKLVSEFQNPATTLEEHSTKIWAFGKERPKYGEDMLTRIYIGVDPRHASDAFQALLEEFGNQGILKDVDVALNLEVLNEKKLAHNQIIIYEPQSRPEVLNSILDAYRQAKLNNPELFGLSDRQKEKIMRGNLQQFKAIIDENASFVEMAPEDRGRSYDAAIVDQTRKAFSLYKLNISDQEWLDTVRKSEGHHGVVWTMADQGKIENGQLQSGDIIHFKRRLSSPALIQTGEVMIK
ncbi:hypothetical protein IID23_01170 [Patescibacteria group bacterium]|nr:hypothetical protein [Patescibacteria group bacterium]